jgi:hypothetical protein
MSYCTITPDRGDRPQFFEYCIQQLKELNGTYPMNAYLMNDKPTSNDFDLVPRVRKGVELAKRDGFKSVYCIESDDYYPKDYFNVLNIGNYDFVGFNSTTYYNLRNRTYATFTHPGRSSLFTTAFKIEALDKFVWPPDNKVFLDISLWRYAKEKKKKVKLYKENPCLGVKHSVGLCGGKGHRMKLRHHDPDLKFLRSRVNDAAFEFYTKMMLTL